MGSGTIVRRHDSHDTRACRPPIHVVIGQGRPMPSLTEAITAQRITDPDRRDTAVPTSDVRHAPQARTAPDARTYENLQTGAATSGPDASARR